MNDDKLYVAHFMQSHERLVYVVDINNAIMCNNVQFYINYMLFHNQYICYQHIYYFSGVFYIDV